MKRTPISIVVNSALKVSGLTLAELTAQNKRRDITDIRKVITVMLSRMGYGAADIGNSISRDRTTIIYHRQHSSFLLKFNKPFQKLYREVYDLVVKTDTYG